MKLTHIRLAEQCGIYRTRLKHYIQQLEVADLENAHLKKKIEQLEKRLEEKEA